jgi:protease-4
MNRKSFYIGSALIMVFLLFPVLHAQSGSVATADDYTAAEINPAALSLENTSGIAFEGFYNEDGTEEVKYKIFLNSHYWSFVYGRNRSMNDYRLSSSIPVFRNFYLGGDMYWINSDIEDADYALSFLYRPHNIISLGMNIKEINLSDPEYHLGAGIRPLGTFADIGDRFTITTDFSYTEDITEKKMSWNKPVVGLETEFLNGLRIAGSYDLERETIGLNLSFCYKRARAGTTVDFDEDNDFTHGKYYLVLARREHRSLPAIFKRDNVYSFKMSKEIVDEKEQRKFGPFLMVKDQETMEETIEKIRKLKEDDSIQGIVFKNPEPKTNYANLLELRRELQDFRDAGKKIIVYGDNYGNLHYAFFASIADVMYLNPNGSVNLIGFSIAIPYLSETLNKLGIDVLDLRSHDFKSGLNIFTENEMTDEERVTYNDLLDDFFFYMAEMLQEGRGEKLKENVDRIVNNGPYFLSEDALDNGLVDKLIYEDDLEETLKEFYANPTITSELPRDKMVTTWAEPKTAKIALIHASGNIVMSDGQPGRTIGGKTTAKQIKQAREDSSVKGIILRVNSGGGSAYASDLITQEVKKCREAGKPVVVSMGGMAASGGYYISAYADRIIAEPTTLTGSIGVTGMIPNFNRLFNKIAVNWSSVKKGDNSDLLAFYRPVAEEEALLLRRYILSSYDDFINVVAEGREMTYDEVHHIAQGRVWTGRKAKELGLVDELGGMQTAMQAMKEIGGFKNIELEDYSYSFSGFSLSIGTGGVLAEERTILNLPEELEALTKYKEMYSQWGKERVLYLMPQFQLNGIE